MNAYSTNEGCLCGGCGKRFKVDILVPDDLWAEISPKPDSLGGGLLCPTCIVTRIERRETFAAFRLVPVDALQQIAGDTYPVYHNPIRAVFEAIDCGDGWSLIDQTVPAWISPEGTYTTSPPWEHSKPLPGRPRVSLDPQTLRRIS